MKALLSSLFLFIYFFSSAQTTTDQLGAVDCNFSFYSNSVHLDVIKQSLIERATAVARKSEIENESYGYAYAYTEWHLEFVSNNAIQSRYRTDDELKSRRQQYHLQFYNKTGDLLMETYIGKDKLKLWKGKVDNGITSIYTYSLNLVNLPLILLDNVSAIQIEFIER